MLISCYYWMREPPLFWNASCTAGFSTPILHRLSPHILAVAVYNAVFMGYTDVDWSPNEIPNVYCLNYKKEEKTTSNVSISCMNASGPAAHRVRSISWWLQETCEKWPANVHLKSPHRIMTREQYALKVTSATLSRLLEASHYSFHVVDIRNGEYAILGIYRTERILLFYGQVKSRPPSEKSNINAHFAV